MTLGSVVSSIMAHLLHSRQIVYGVPAMFTYSGSPSPGLLLSVLHTVYLTGFLSLSLPKNLTAFWSNFAWSLGLIYVGPIQRVIDDMGGNYVKPLELGYTEKVVRTIYSLYFPRHTLSKRGGQMVEYGAPVRPGLPIPGTYGGLSGTLAASNIAVPNAFLTSMFFILCTHVAFWLILKFGSCMIASRMFSPWPIILETKVGFYQTPRWTQICTGSQIRLVDTSQPDIEVDRHVPAG